MCVCVLNFQICFVNARARTSRSDKDGLVNDYCNDTPHSAKNRQGRSRNDTHAHAHTYKHSLLLALTSRNSKNALGMPILRKFSRPGLSFAVQKKLPRAKDMGGEGGSEGRGSTAFFLHRRNRWRNNLEKSFSPLLQTRDPATHTLHNTIKVLEYS